MRQNGKYTVHVPGRGDIQFPDAGTGMRAVQQLAGQYARQIDVRAIAGGAGNDIFSPGSRNPLADGPVILDDCIFHGLSPPPSIARSSEAACSTALTTAW